MNIEDASSGGIGSLSPCEPSFCSATNYWAWCGLYGGWVRAWCNKLFSGSVQAVFMQYLKFNSVINFNTFFLSPCQFRFIVKTWKSLKTLWLVNYLQQICSIAWKKNEWWCWIKECFCYSTFQLSEQQIEHTKKCSKFSKILWNVLQSNVSTLYLRVIY